MRAPSPSRGFFAGFLSGPNFLRALLGSKALLGPKASAPKTSLVAVAATCLSLATTFSLVACTNQSSTELSKADCQHVRSHISELAMADFHPPGLTPEELAKERAAHLANFASLGGGASLDKCQQTRSSQWLACALASETLAALEACPL